MYAVFWHLPLAVISGYLFVTTANNPGFLDEYPSNGAQQSAVANKNNSVVVVPNAEDDMADIEMAQVTKRNLEESTEEPEVELASEVE